MSDVAQTVVPTYQDAIWMPTGDIENLGASRQIVGRLRTWENADHALHRHGPSLAVAESLWKLVPQPGDPEDFRIIPSSELHFVGRVHTELEDDPKHKHVVGTKKVHERRAMPDQANNDKEKEPKPVPIPTVPEPSPSVPIETQPPVEVKKNRVE